MMFIYKGQKGTPVIFFVARPGTRHKIPRDQVNELETFLIQSAMYKNPELKNKQKTKLVAWGIRGVVRGGRGRQAANAKSFKIMMDV